MALRTVTFSGSVKNTGNVAARYKVRLFVRHVLADPGGGGPFDFRQSIITDYVSPGVTSPVSLTIANLSLSPGDMLVQMAVSLDIMTPVALSDVSSPVTASDFKEAVTTGGMLAGTISVAARRPFAAGIKLVGGAYRLVGQDKVLRVIST